MSQIFKQLKYVEITVDKGCSKETGLFLNYDGYSNTLRLTLSNMYSVGVYNLNLLLITDISITDEYKSTSRIFTSTTESQKLAKELLCELLNSFKIENRLTATNFINISSYKNIPSKYIISNVLPVTTSINNYTAPKINFLTALPTNHVQCNKKIAVIFRKSEMPTKKALLAMFKKVDAVTQNVYKLKIEALNEKEVNKDVCNEEIDTDPYGVYGEYGDDYCSIYNFKKAL